MGYSAKILSFCTGQFTFINNFRFVQSMNICLRQIVGYKQLVHDVEKLR